MCGYRCKCGFRCECKPIRCATECVREGKLGWGVSVGENVGVGESVSESVGLGVNKWELSWGVDLLCGGESVSRV